MAFQSLRSVVPVSPEVSFRQWIGLLLIAFGQFGFPAYYVVFGAPHVDRSYLRHVLSTLPLVQVSDFIRHIRSMAAGLHHRPYFFYSVSITFTWSMHYHELL